MNREERINKEIEKIKQLKIADEKKERIIASIYDSVGMYEDFIKEGFPDETEFPHTTAYISAIKPIPDNFIEIVMKWMPKLKYKFLAIIFLRESKNKYDGRVLIPIFNESNQQDKWRICDGIVYNPPLNINDWVKDTYLDKQYGYSETGLLPLAVAKMFPKDEARAILKQGFDHHPEVTPEALGKVGTAEDLPFLEEKLERKYEKKFIYKEIEKAIKKIKKRAKIL